MKEKIKEFKNEIIKDTQISQLDPMLKLEIAREVVQELSGQNNHWLNMKPVDDKSYQEVTKALWKTLEVMKHCEFLFKKDDEKAEDNAA